MAADQYVPAIGEQVAGKQAFEKVTFGRPWGKVLCGCRGAGGVAPAGRDGGGVRQRVSASAASASGASQSSPSRNRNASTTIGRDRAVAIPVFRAANTPA